MTAAALRDISDETPVRAAERPARPRFKLPFSRRTLLAVGVALVLAAAGAVYIASPKPTVSTDAAYLQADSVSVAPG